MSFPATPLSVVNRLLGDPFTVYTLFYWGGKVFPLFLLLFLLSVGFTFFFESFLVDPVLPFEEN